MSEIAKVQKFEDRLTERIKNDIGELIGDEELKALIAKTVQKLFFEERTVNLGYGRTETRPPEIAETIKGLMHDRVDFALREFMAENTDNVMHLIRHQIQDGFSSLVMRSIDRYFKSVLSDFELRIQHDMDVLRNQL